MSRTKFTPGPWELIPEFSEIRTVQPDDTSNYGNGTPICGIFDMSTNYERSSANARLIAQAPAMYDMLLLCETLIANFNDPNLNVIAHNIDDLLRKARGE